MGSPNSDSFGQHAGVDELDAIVRLRAQFESVARTLVPLRTIPPSGDTWIGDDAAVTDLGTARAIWATDLVVEGVHVDLGLCGLDDLGYKALMVTVSDLAAMGAWPRYGLVSIAAPRGTDLELLGVGLASASEDSACVVVGGDLSESPVVVVSTSAVGTLRSDPATGALLRSGANPSDRLFLTGALGGSAGGLRVLRAGNPLGEPDAVSLARAYRRPVARLREGEVARLSGVTAAIDISDGLVTDLRHLAEASGVGVELEALPVTGGATEEEALGGGEDYELLLATGDPDRLVRAYRSEGLRPPLPVGRCTDRPGEFSWSGCPLPEGGWHHRF